MNQYNNPQKIEQVSDNKGKNNILMHSKMTQIFSGPLPHPEVFEKYEKVLPGSADRILIMAEDQGAHRHFLEKTVIVGEQFRANIGLFFGFIIVMCLVVGGLIMVYSEKELQGFTTLLIGVGSLVGTFVYGKKQKRDDLKQKDEDLRNRIK